MEHFALRQLDGYAIAVDPNADGGALLDITFHGDDVFDVNLTRLELVALRDWLIAYTG